VWNKGDILLTVNGEDIGGKTLPDITLWIKDITEETITMTFLCRNWFNGSGHKSVRKC
jgi:hypothetical protein